MIHDLLTYRDKPARRHSEEDLQKAVWQHVILKAPDAIAFAIPNGEYRSKRTGARLKAQGVVAGVPDMAFVLQGGTIAFMEFKAAKGRLSPAQKAFIAKCEALAVPVAVVSDIDQALAVLARWGVLHGRLPLDQRRRWRPE